MTNIQPILQRLGLDQYYEAFLAEGFDTWETVLDIQENDLKFLDVKLGHRRKLQRAIAVSRGVANDRPLKSPPREIVPEDVPKSEGISQVSSSKDPAPSTASEQKRKYRRHPKPDENAPEKPPSAYVLFSNRVREEIKAENLSFTEIARLVGERWQKLDPSQKEHFESHAGALKENYNKELADYKKTDAYKEYMQYYTEFKAKNATAGDTKRPKLEHHGSSSISGGSMGESGESLAHSIPGHARKHSNSSGSGASQAASMTFPLAVVAPMVDISDVRSGLITLPFQERRLVGQLSNQSSNSEDPSTPRFDPPDALSRTAALSLDTPPQVTPSSYTGTPRPGRRDQGYVTNRQQWPGRHASYGFAIPEAATASPSGSLPLAPASSTAAATDPWQERGLEASFYSGGLSLPPQQTSSVPISQLIGPQQGQDPGSASSQRVLPPLRQYPGTTTSIPVSGFVGLATPHLTHTYHNTHEPMAYQQNPLRDPSHQSESEAADALTALAEQERSFSQSTTPRPRRGQE